MFELERFVADCRTALAEDPTHKAVREVLASAVSDPVVVLKGLGEPRRAEIQKSFIRMPSQLSMSSGRPE